MTSHDKRKVSRLKKWKHWYVNVLNSLPQRRFRYLVYIKESCLNLICAQSKYIYSINYNLPGFRTQIKKLSGSKSLVQARLKDMT